MANLYPQTQENFSQLKYAAGLVDASGVVELVEGWRIEDGLQTGRGGRPQFVTTRTAIVLWVHMALTKRPQLVARMSEVVAFGMKPYMRDYFSLVNEDVDLSTRDGRMDYNNDWYHRIWRALERVRATMEPYPQVSRHGRHTVDEWLEFMDLLGLDSKKTSKKNYEPTEEELLAEKRIARCDEFSNRLLWATVEKFGDKLGEWNGDVAVDGTAFKVSANGNPNKQDMLAGKVPGHRKVASTPTLGNYSKGADDHNGDAKPSKGDNMWAGEATFATMEGDGVGRKGGLPSLILGMSFHRPGAKPWQRALRSLTNVFARPELPRGRFLGDRLYLPGQKAENLQVPLRKAGYDLIGDYKKNELGLQTELASGAVVVDGQLYCPVMKARQRLVNATADFQNGRIDEDEYYALLNERKKLQLAPLGKPVKGDGKQRFQCPARSKNAKVTCPLVKRSQEKHPNRAKEPLLESEVPTSGMCGAVCKQTSITVQNTPEDGAKYLNQGAPYGTKEWQEQYHRRNTIESRNDRVKSSRHQGHGDPTMRLMRGWAAQAISAVMSAVAANIGLLSAESRWRFPKKPTPPATPPDGRKTRGRNETDTDAFPNAPPLAA